MYNYIKDFIIKIMDNKGSQSNGSGSHTNGSPDPKGPGGGSGVPPVEDERARTNRRARDRYHAKPEKKKNQ